MSPSSQRKWVWTRVKDALKGGGRRGEEEEGTHHSMSAPSSPASAAAEALTFDFDLEKGGWIGGRVLFNLPSSAICLGKHSIFHYNKKTINFIMFVECFKLLVLLL